MSVVIAPSARPTRLAARDYAKNPMLVYWEMTQACALACRHCRAEAMPQPHPLELNHAESKDLLRQVAAFGEPLPHLILTGGDPLQRADLFDLIDEANALGLNVSITPSATQNLTRQIIAQLKAHGIQSLGLSLDGSTAARHDAVRGIPGCFDWTMRTAHWAAEFDLPIQVNTLVAAETADDLPAIYELLKPHPHPPRRRGGRGGVMRWSLFFLIAVGRGRALREISPERGEEMMHWIYDLGRVAPFAIKTTEAPSYRRVALNRMRQEGMSPEQIQRTSVYHGFGIRDGHGIMFISSTGDIYPAGFLPLAVGNVRKDSVVEIYRHAPVFRSLHDPNQCKGKCGRCEYRVICGGSRARAFAYTGDPLESDPFCPYEPHQRLPVSGRHLDPVHLEGVHGGTPSRCTGLLNDRFLRACRREPVDRTPIWLMRQAGRYLPEYRALREKHDLLTMCTTPELAVQVTLQPLQRFALDAAILFSDIMVPLRGMGVEFEIVESVGPVVAHPIRDEHDVDALQVIDPEADVPFVLEAIRLLRHELDGKLPLIGFAGAPFTLASYLVDGKPSRDLLRTKSLMHSNPTAWHTLMDKLVDTLSRYLLAQIRAGAQAVQLFDSWVGALSPRDYREFVLPYTKRIFDALAPTRVPRIHFGTGTAALLELMKEAGGDVIGVDWRVPLDQVWLRLGDVAVQGNLDPAILLTTPDVVEKHAREILAQAKDRKAPIHYTESKYRGKGHIFNLGHGVLPNTPIENVERLIEVVHTYRSGGVIRNSNFEIRNLLQEPDGKQCR